MGRKVIFLILIGSLSWILTMIKSGLNYPFGLGFWGANGHDGVWHLALINSLAKGSFEMPSFAGSALQNYHIGFDLFTALLHRLTSISTITLYFQILPVICAISIGLLGFIFVKNWKKSETAALWSIFFVYFGGSIAWILGKGESTFWSQQAISTLINPPYAWSLVFLLLGLISLQKKKLIFAIIFFGVLVEIKVYAAVLGLMGLFIISLIDFVKSKSIFNLKVFIGSLILSIILFIPLNKNSTGILVWQPFWFLETMMSYSDRVGWFKFYEAMTTYRVSDPIKFILSYGFAFVIFWFGNLGTRAIKELEVLRWIKNPKLVNSFEVFFAIAILAGVTIPMLFLQKGTPWNTIQFLYYSIFFSSLLAGVAVSNLQSKINNSRLRYLFGVGVVLLTIPTTLITLKDVYLPSRPPAMLPSAELEALNFLSMQPEGIVLTFPFDSAKAKEAESDPPRPLYLYESTAYVSAFANKSVYLEDEVNLDITGYEWKTRREQVDEFYRSLDQKYVYEFLRVNDISYIYWVGSQRATLGEDQLGIERIFENSEVDIYRVK